MTSPTITPKQYLAALKALGLDPAHTVTVTLQADYAHVTTVVLDASGAPVIELGRLTTESTSVPITDAPGAGA